MTAAPNQRAEIRFDNQVAPVTGAGRVLGTLHYSATLLLLVSQNSYMDKA